MEKKEITKKENIVRKIKKPQSSREEIVIDASGKILGRISTQAAIYLQGKHKASYRPNIDENLVVRIKNAKKVKVTGKKKTDKIYWSYSGYPGGIYGRTFEEVVKKDPTRVIRYAVKGMLPKNKLQKPRLKRLIIEE